MPLVDVLCPKCPCSAGSREAIEWWEDYIATVAIPAALARGRQLRAAEKALKEARHGHDFDPWNRVCRLCGKFRCDYDDDLWGGRATICPACQEGSPCPS